MSNNKQKLLAELEQNFDRFEPSEVAKIIFNQINFGRFSEVQIERFKSLFTACFDSAMDYFQKRSEQAMPETLRIANETNKTLLQIDKQKDQILNKTTWRNAELSVENKKFRGHPQYTEAIKRRIVEMLNTEYNKSIKRTDKGKKNDAYAFIIDLLEKEQAKAPCNKILAKWWKETNPELFSPRKQDRN